MRWIKEVGKAVLKFSLGDYALYEVWRAPIQLPKCALPPGCTIRPVHEMDLSVATDSDLRQQAWYLGAQAHCWGCYQGEQLLALAIYWHGLRYLERRSWVIEPQAAKLVELITAPAARGQGLASALITESAVLMREQGFDPLYARVWHSNQPSKKAFFRAGWCRIGTLVQVNPLRADRPWTLRWRFSRARPEFAQRLRPFK